MRRDGHQIVAPADHGARAAVHTPQYLRFLETAYARWRELPDASEEVVANVHPFPGQPCTYPEHIVGLAGYHMGDTACPIGAGTWEAAAWSAHCATTRPSWCWTASARPTRCRPPGHHAYVDRANGFCYLNNAAIAAQHLRAAHARVAVLDLDVHHGNGTQGIFYRRADVLTVSMHADAHHAVLRRPRPRDRRGRRLGYNINRPLPVGTGDAGYLEALRRVFLDIRAYAPGALVVALGLDAHERDPYKGLAVTTEGFGLILAEVARLGLPTVLVQEGGYLSDDLGPNLASALRGFDSAA